MLLTTHDERMAAHAEKRRRVLAFLRTETWTTPGVLSELIGDRSSASRLVSSLERDGLVVVESLPFGRKAVGITPTGQAEAAAVTGKPPGRAFERGRVPVSTLDHRLNLQRLRISLARAGWSGWVYPDRQPVAQKSRKDTHRPDAVVTTPGGVRVALEVERTVKTAKRYRFVIGRHLAQISAGMYTYVIYACPTPAMAAAVAAVVHKLGHVVVSGQDKKLTADDFLRFSFLSYQEVPSWRP